MYVVGERISIITVDLLCSGRHSQFIARFMIVLFCVFECRLGGLCLAVLWYGDGDFGLFDWRVFFVFGHAGSHFDNLNNNIGAA
jgi:hypothetical protein